MRIKTIVLTAALSIMCIFTLAGCQKKIHLEEKSFTAETEIKTIVFDDESMDIEFNSSSTAKNITVDYLYNIHKHTTLLYDDVNTPFCYHI